MIRCVRLWTGDDGDSHFEEGTIDLSKGERGDVLSEVVAAAGLSFQETKSGGSYEWHQDPVPRFVVTLAARSNSKLEEASALLSVPAISSWGGHSGSGHRWKLIGDEPWRRAYVVFPTGAVTPVQSLLSLTHGGGPCHTFRRSRCGPDRRRHHERHARHGPQGLASRRSRLPCSRRSRTARRKVPRLGTMPGPATRPIAS